MKLTKPKHERQHVASFKKSVVALSRRNNMEAETKRYGSQKRPQLIKGTLFRVTNHLFRYAEGCSRQSYYVPQEFDYAIIYETRKSEKTNSAKFHDSPGFA